MKQYLLVILFLCRNGSSVPRRNPLFFKESGLCSIDILRDEPAFPADSLQCVRFDLLVELSLPS